MAWDCGGWEKMYKANLLPAELQKDFEINTRKLGTLAVATAAITIIVLFYISFLIKIYYLENDLEAKKSNLVQLQKIAKKVEEIRKEIDFLTKEKDSLLKLKQERLVFTVILTDLNLNIPRNTWLTGINYNPGTRELALTGATRDSQEAGIFVYNLNNLPYFTKVMLNQTVRNDAGYFDFSIKAILK